MSDRYTEDAFEFTETDHYVRELRSYKDKDCFDKRSRPLNLG